jgi:hypothetical protein
MKTEPCSSQLSHACHVLFGPEIDVSTDFLRCLQMPGLKAAYRVRALETHPDRAIALSLPSADLEEKFKEVNAAYRELNDYLQNPFRLKRLGDPFPARPHQASARRNPGAGPWIKKTCASPDRVREHFFRGTVPSRRVLFGQFIYYSGCISYRQLIDAILWQKVRRPLIGQIALRWRFLYEDEIPEILKHRRRGEKFGDAALRGGYLTPDDLRVILGWQRLLQPRIGSYFVEKRLMTVSVVEKMVERLRRHNGQFNTR